MSEQLEMLLAELRQFRSTVQRLVDHVIEHQKQAKAFQQVLLKKGLVTAEELAQASLDASRQVMQAGGDRPGHRRRRIKGVRKTRPV
jgi:hypothetical protein